MNPQIKFSHNWNNKLGNKIFTTIRRSTPMKSDYYCNLVGRTFDVLLKNKKVREAKLWNVDTRPFSEVEMYLLLLDTGEINVPKQFKIFEDFGVNIREDDVIILTFENIKVMDKTILDFPVETYTNDNYRENALKSITQKSKSPDQVMNFLNKKNRSAQDILDFCGEKK